MRAKQSFIANGMYSKIGTATFHRPHPATQHRCPLGLSTPQAGVVSDDSAPNQSSPPTLVEKEGLLHDARNLIGTIGLYCDLLAMPGVLKPEHAEYPKELRLLGERSASLIDHLMQMLLTRQDAEVSCPVLARRFSDSQGCTAATTRQTPLMPENERLIAPIALGSVVDRCSGLLTRVASGRRVEVLCGPAASTPVRVSEEAVERILVNLVRNASAAMGGGDARDLTPIRVTVGLLASRVGELKPWPFQRVRLSVEDAGCGMNNEQLHALLRGDEEPRQDGHGIGFRVVRELVTASGGELQVMSAPDCGTRVQIEWPVAAYADEPGMGRVETIMDGLVPQWLLGPDPTKLDRRRLSDGSAQAMQGVGSC